VITKITEEVVLQHLSSGGGHDLKKVGKGGKLKHRGGKKNKFDAENGPAHLIQKKRNTQCEK